MAIRNAFYGALRGISAKGDSEIKGRGKYEIKSPSADCGENDIAIATHLGSGEIQTESGSLAKIGICGVLQKKSRCGYRK